MATRQLGLSTYDLGPWIRKEHSYRQWYLEHTISGARVYALYVNERRNLPHQYVVSLGDFSIGFSCPDFYLDWDTDDPEFDGYHLKIDRIGGTYWSRYYKDGELWPVLADASGFENKSQQDLVISILKDAVPRIPATAQFFSRWNGGFGFQVQFTGEAKSQLRT